MRVGQLSALARVPLATIKYYRRTGLLQAPTKTADNQAQYGEAHLRRLRLLRALVTVTPLPLSELQALFSVGGGPAHPPVERAARLLAVRTQAPATDEDENPPGGVTAADGAAAHSGAADLDFVLELAAWQVETASSTRTLAASVLAQMHLLEAAPTRETLRLWAQAADQIAERDLAEGQDVDADPVTAVLARNLLGDILIAAFRRMAQEHRSSGGEVQPT